MAPRGTLAERLWRRVQKGGSDDCWIWLGYVTKLGYGRIKRINHEGIREMAPTHRVAWELENGPIPKGLELDHLCRVPACVNPAHLEPVTHKENILRGNWSPVLNAAKTHCPRGHPYDETNTFWTIREGKYPFRRCRTCKAIYDSKRRERNKD